MLHISVHVIIEHLSWYLELQNTQQLLIYGLLVICLNNSGCVIVEMLIGEPLFPGESATD